MARIVRNVAIAVLVLVAALAAGAAEPWQPLGIGGGGGMFSLATSPLDTKLMMINCDMSGAYLSRDGGRTWRMIRHDMLRGCTWCCPVFHPTVAGRVYAVNGWSNEIRTSNDGGETWRPIAAKPPGEGRVWLLYVDPDRPKSVLAGVGEGACFSLDDAATWRPCKGVAGQVLAIVSARVAPPKPATYFIATTQGVFRCDDGGESFSPCGGGLPKAKITGLAGGFKDGAGRLYATVECSLSDGELAGGVYVSADGGRTWQRRMTGGLNVQTQRKDEWANGDIPQYRFPATTDGDPMRVYVYCAGTSYWPPNHATVYRSDDGGATWRAVLFSDPRFSRLKLYNVQDDWVSAGIGQRYQDRPYSMVANSADPDIVMLCSSSWVLRTDDGGKSWRVPHTGPAVGGDEGGKSWRCNGLVVTTTWNYYIDPHEAKRHYICYTDIGFARSIDAGESWIWQGYKLPWRNTAYELAFDPAVAGRIWAALSNTHDIPNDNVISGRHRVIMQGGVAVSDDFGISWRKLDLPQAPTLSVVLDPASPKDSRVLYASLFEKGVYKSADGGKTWRPMNAGLGHPDNMRCCKLHRAEDGTLFVLITAKRIGGQHTLDGVGLYRWDEAAARWAKITESLPLHWPKDFTVKPGDTKTVLLSAARIRGHADEAGLYRTTDGGKTWKKLVQKGPEHFGAFYHPAKPGWIYVTLTEGAPDAGLYLSKDDGATWQPFTTLPFSNIQRVHFDPARPGEIIVTTFGGSVWRGPAEPVK